METALHHGTGEVPAIDADGDVEGYFDVLRDEHERLLAALRRASTLIEPGAGQLASLAATHVRLTQRFFDAQRGLLRRRAAVDAEIAHLRYTAEADARALLAAAHEEAAARTVRRALAASHNGPGEHPVLAEWDAERVVAAPLDIEALARSIEADVRGRDETATLAQRQLGDLVDEWWTTEQREGRDRLDDATARAAMLQHLVLQEVEAIVSSAATDDTMPESIDDTSLRVLPVELIDALDTAGDRGLHGLLDELTNWLDREDGVVETRIPLAPPAAPLIRFDEPAAVRVQPPAPEQAAPELAPTSPGDEALFWGEPATAPRAVLADPATPTLPSLLVRAVVPVGVFTALLGLLMAWIG